MGAETRSQDHPDQAEINPQVEDLSKRVLQAVSSVVEGRREEGAKEFNALLERLQEIFSANLEMAALKREVAELVRAQIEDRMRSGFKAVVRRDGDDPASLLGFLMGTIFTTHALSDLVGALDRVLLEQGRPQEFTFAGLGDFIAVQEVMQLLSTGQHTGILSVDKADNSIDLYFREGTVAFIDPRVLNRRVIRGEGLQEYREIKVEIAQEAEERREKEGKPIYLHLLETGFFTDQEFQAFLLAQGSDLVFELVRESDECVYRWNRLAELPEFVAEHDMRLRVMPILLDAHKQMDDWRIVRRIIPDNDEPIHPAEDRFAKMAELSMDASQIKLLAIVNGENTVRRIAEIAGIPAFEVASMLADFAKKGIIEPPAGPKSLLDQPQTSQESVEWALSALDANEHLDALEVKDGLNNIFGALDGGGPEEAGGEEGDEGGEYDGEPPPDQEDGFSLEFLRAAKKNPRRWRSRANRRR